MPRSVGYRDRQRRRTKYSQSIHRLYCLCGVFVSKDQESQNLEGMNQDHETHQQHDKIGHCGVLGVEVRCKAG